MEEFKASLIKLAIIGSALILGMGFLGLGGDGGSGSDSDSDYYQVSSDDILREYISSFENNAMLGYLKGNISDYKSNKYIYICVNEEKTQYLCHEDIGLRNYTSNFGFGVCHIHKGSVRFTEEYKTASGGAIDITDDLYKHVDKNSIIHKMNPSHESDPSSTREVRIDVDVVNTVQSNLIQNTFVSAVKKGYEKQMGAGKELPEHQVHAYACVLYKRGQNSKVNYSSPKSNSFWSGCKDYTKEEVEAMSQSELAEISKERNQSTWVLFNTGIYVANGGIILDPNDYTSGGTGSDTNISKTDSFDNFVFIGDSYTKKLGVYTENDDAFANAKFHAEDSKTASYWLEHFGELPDSANAVCVLLGANNPSTAHAEDMKKLIDKLVEKYGTSKPIYIQRVFPVGSGYKYKTLNAATMLSNINKYNETVSKYCDKYDNVKFIDTTSGCIDSNGYLKSELTSDNLHLNNDGYAKWVENLKSTLLN